jgi:D-alanyl-lipoteichoic acid acyltransferase DltB (MBOAT superfamily)
MNALIYGEGNALTDLIGGYTLNIPALGHLVKQGSHASHRLAWISIYCELIKQVLRHAAGGHGIIGILRLFGFNVFRNTYKPLLAESIVEFWNRYYYYFKELLTHFFFMPAFVGFGKKLQAWPNVRLFVAVFSAAFVGNMYYHLLDKSAILAQGNTSDAITSLLPRLFYCFLLVIGIYVSMLREARRRQQPSTQKRMSRVLRIFCVWTFFALIFIWNVTGRASFYSRVDFFLGLFGLSF